MAIQWPLVLFSLLAGAGGGMLAFVGLSEVLGGSCAVRRRGCWAALALFVVGGLCSVAHLASPLHAISAVTNLLSFSGISIELMLLGCSFVVACAYLVVTKEGKQSAASKVIAVIGIVAGLAIGFFCGHGYVIDAQPTWNTEVLPLAYLGTSLALGALVYGCLAESFGGDDAAAELGGKLRIALLVATIFGAVCAAAYGIFLGLDRISDAQSVVWAVLALVGLIGSVACVAVAWNRFGGKSAVSFVVAAIVLAAVAAIALRALMWMCAVGYVNLFAHTVPSLMLNL